MNSFQLNDNIRVKLSYSTGILFEEQTSSHSTLLLYPSIHSRMLKPNSFSLSLPSMCHNWFGPSTQHFRLWNWCSCVNETSSGFNDFSAVRTVSVSANILFAHKRWGIMRNPTSKIIYNQIFCSHFNFPPFAFINISCNNKISMIWRVNTCDKQQRKQVTSYL